MKTPIWLISRNPPEGLSILKVDLLSIALEEDRANVKGSTKDSAFKANGILDDAMANYIDRVVLP